MSSRMSVRVVYEQAFRLGGGVERVIRRNESQRRHAYGEPMDLVLETKSQVERHHSYATREFQRGSSRAPAHWV